MVTKFSIQDILRQEDVDYIDHLELENNDLKKQLLKQKEATQEMLEMYVND